LKDEKCSQYNKMSIDLSLLIFVKEQFLLDIILYLTKISVLGKISTPENTETIYLPKPLSPLHNYDVEV